MKPENLTKEDIKMMEVIIRACSQRGAIQPQEMSDVGILYKKLLEILKE
jgi:hypothetical protein